MNTEELRRGEVLSRVKRGELKLSEAAALMQISYRQAKRLKKSYLAGGARSLVHGNVGRASNRAKPAAIREQALALIGRHYSGSAQQRFGPTLAAEHLAADHGIQVARETLRGWMLSAGLWSRRRKRKPHRRRRERKAHFGELLQLDGSHHRWLEDRAGEGCLMNLVDDATGRGLFRFSEEETTWAAAELLERWVRAHGVPQALYVDGKNVYKRQATTKEAVAGIQPETQFGRMCAKLGIRIIGASSPQAKGRVERHHGTHQDRLVKKMRLAGIGDYEAANRYLDERYLQEHNERFARAPDAAADFHRRVRKRIKLEQVFCLESERVVSNDLVVRFDNLLLQLEPKRNQRVGAGSRVIVRRLQDRSIRIVSDERAVAFREILPAAKTPRVVAAHKPGAGPPLAQRTAMAKTSGHFGTLKGDTSIWLSKGTFLSGVDSSRRDVLTSADGEATLR